MPFFRGARYALSSGGGVGAGSSGGGSPTLWTPAELGADVILWWDFSDQGNLTLSGSRITAVTDLSPAGESSSISGTTNQQPSSATVGDWDNLFGAVFDPTDGGDDQISAAAGVAQPWGCAMIFQTGGSIAELEQLWGSGGNTQVSLKWSGIGNNPHCFAGSAVQRWAANLAGATNYIDITVFDGASSVTRINGVAGSSFNPGAASEAGNGIGIGKFNGGFGASKCTYGEAIFFDAALSSDDYEKLEGYLAHKFAQSALLDVSHPYKAGPPTL